MINVAIAHETDNFTEVTLKYGLDRHDVVKTDLYWILIMRYYNDKTLNELFQSGKSGFFINQTIHQW